MGILDDYLNSSEAVVAPTEKKVGLLQQYLDSGKSEVSTKKNADPKPPISGISKEASDELNATREAKVGGANPRDGISSVPTKAVGKGWDAAKGGVLEAGQGLGEALSGKPASGLGKVGMGALQIFGSPWEAASSAATDLTGNKDFGDKVGLGITGALPVKMIAPYSPLRLPTASNLNPFVNPKSKLAKNKALSDLVDDITSGGKDNQALVDTVAAMKADPRIGPVDVSPVVLGATQKLFVKDGDVAKSYLHKTSKDRLSKLGDDVSAAFDEAAGTPVNVVQKLNELSASAKKAGNDIINPALAGAKPVDISDTLGALDKILKPGVLKIGDSVPLTSVKKELESIRRDLRTSKEYDAKDLHSFQSGLRNTASELLKSTDGASRSMGEALMNVRNNLVNDIDKVSPKIKTMKDGVETEVGQYKHGLNAYREEKDLANAFREGYQSSAKGMEKDPNFTRQWFDSLTDYEKEAAREGKRLSISHKMGKSENPSLAGTKAARSDFDKQELEIFFGKEGAEKLLQSLEFTRAIKNSDQKIIEGSQTGARVAADKRSDLPVKEDGNPINKYITPAAAAGAEMLLGGGTGLGAAAVGALATTAKLASVATLKAKVALAKERNARYAQYALPTEGPSRDALIKQLEAYIPGPKQSLVSRVSSKFPIAP